jgi:hypothetical protein
MDRIELSRLALDLPPYRVGAPQQSGALAVLPLFGPRARGEFATPLSGLKLSAVRGYGNMELEHSGGPGVAIVPLHMGYIQDKAQNHALCRSAFIGAGQKLMFQDACCVQAAQSGYLEGRQQWFFVLPLPLRSEALALRGQEGYSKLWPAISRLNGRFKMDKRGHLEQIVSRKRAYLTQYASRFELLPGQTGALFFFEGALAGVEIAPTAEYFAEVWAPLVCFCYGTVAMHGEQYGARRNGQRPLEGASVGELRARLGAEREEARRRLFDGLAALPADSFTVAEEERYLSLSLFTATSGHFAGQIVKDGDGVVYVSIAATPKRLGWEN